VAARISVIDSADDRRAPVGEEDTGLDAYRACGMGE
jgi:hypothetical protein